MFWKRKPKCTQEWKPEEPRTLTGIEMMELEEYAGRVEESGRIWHS